MNWISNVNGMDGTRKVSRVFSNNPQGSRLGGRPKNRKWNCVQKMLIDGKLEEGLKAELTGWGKSVKEAKVVIGLQCHLWRRRRRIRRRRRRRSRREGGDQGGGGGEEVGEKEETKEEEGEKK